MYLKITTLLDLLTADGKKISKDIYQVSPYGTSVTPSTYAYEWPSIPEPTSSEKKNNSKNNHGSYKTNTLNRPGYWIQMGY